jgi:hypothetical protein
MRKDNIRLLMNHLPDGFEKAAKDTGAFVRKGKVIKNTSDLMWLALTHLSQGSTLVNTSVLSETAGPGKISDVAFMNRFANCKDWFKWILQRTASSGIADYLKPAGFENYRMLAADASRVCSGVSKFGKTWNLHFALDIFSMSSHEFKITDEKTGETLANFTARKGDLFFGDRVYASKRSMAHCLSGGADFVLRLRSDAFSIYSEDGRKIDLSKQLAAAGTNRAADIPVSVDLSKYGMGTAKLRVCALKKSERDIENTHARINRKDSRRQKTTSARAREFNEHIVLVTSLPESIDADKVLSAYRYRWQAELYFKRFKSLLGAGEIPKKREDCMEAWLNGKLLYGILLEILLSKLDFPPLGDWEDGNERLEKIVFHRVGSNVQSCFVG